MDRSVIIITPYFSPSTATGVHRVRHLARHLPAAGWRPTVVCVDEAFYEHKLDYSLLALTPPDTEIVKASALPRWASRPFGLGDISLRAWPQMRSRVEELLRTRPISAVLITSGPYYTLMLAPLIRRRFGVPVVVDFQDPWVSAWGAKQPRWSKLGLSHWAAARLEPHVVRNADFITSVSEVQNDEMAVRYPWLDRSRMAAIPIGGDPGDFDHARTTDAWRKMPKREGRVELSYVGSYWPAAAAPFRAFFKGIARLRAMDPGVIDRLGMNFVGTAPGPGSGPIQALAEAEGLSDCVREVPGRLTYLEALDVTAQSDGLLLLGSDEPHYTASKIYPALMSGRPYLSLFHKSSDAHALLSAAGGGKALAFSNAAELAALELPIAEALRTLVLAPRSFGRADEAVYAPFEARMIARRYAAIFDGVSKQQAQPHAV